MAAEPPHGLVIVPPGPQSHLTEDNGNVPGLKQNTRIKLSIHMVPDLIAGNDRASKLSYRPMTIDQSIIGSFEAATWRFLLGPQVFRE